MTRILITGVCGKAGAPLAQLVADRDDLEVLGAIASRHEEQCRPAPPPCWRAIAKRSLAVRGVSRG